MGKKSSVVFISLLTIVIAVLCAIVAFPKVAIPGKGGIKYWNPTVLQYDLGVDLGGGYYTYYYPEGVKPEAEYKQEKIAAEAAVAEAKDALEKVDATDSKAVKEAEKTLKNREDALKDLVEGYQKVEGINGLYFTTDEEKGILELNDDEKWVITEAFDTAFATAANEMKNRFAAKEYEYHRVAIVDKYSLRVEIAASENTDSYTSSQHAATAFSRFNHFGALTIHQDDTLVSALEGEGVTAKDLIKRITLKTQYDVVFLRVEFTSAGKDMIKKFKSDGASALTFQIGGVAISDISISSDYITSKNIVELPIANSGDARYAETLSIVLNSALNTGDIVIGETETNFAFRTFDTNAIRTFDSIYGKNTIYFLYGVVVAVMLALMVFAVVKMGGFGVVNVYTNLSYFVIAAICFAFITKGALELTAGAFLIFFIGLVLVNVFQWITYYAIKKEFSLGKTVASAVKGGYKKSFLPTLDVYAVLVAAAATLLIAVGGLNVFAIQAMVCVIAAAFCSLIWGRVINYLLMTASKDKVKYFRFVREDDDDE